MKLESLKDRWDVLIAQKMKFSIEDFFSKCDQIRSFLRNYLLFPEYKKCQVASHTWHSCNEDQRKDYIEKFWAYTPTIGDSFTMPKDVQAKSISW